jgi:hypothetical protein
MTTIYKISFKEDNRALFIGHTKRPLSKVLWDHIHREKKHPTYQDLKKTLDLARQSKIEINIERLDICSTKNRISLENEWVNKLQPLFRKRKGEYKAATRSKEWREAKKRDPEWVKQERERMSQVYTKRKLKKENQELSSENVKIRFELHLKQI